MSMMIHRHFGGQHENKEITKLADVTPTAEHETNETIEHYGGPPVNTAQRRGRPPKNR